MCRDLSAATLPAESGRPGTRHFADVHAETEGDYGRLQKMFRREPALLFERIAEREAECETSGKRGRRTDVPSGGGVRVNRAS